MPLSVEDVCIIESPAGGQNSVVIAADQTGFGLGSRRVYPPGSHRPDGADRQHGWMVYWNSFPEQVDTWFVGEPPIPEHVYAVKATVTCGVDVPARVHSGLLRGRGRLSRVEFRKGLEERVSSILSRLVCEYSVGALAGGPAMAEAETALRESLTRTYAPMGLAVTHVSLGDITAEVRRRERELLLRKIEADAEEQEVKLEEAYRRNRASIDHAAQAGNAQAKTLSKQLAGVTSVGHLEAAVQQPRRAASKLVLLRAQGGARFIVASSLEPARYLQVVRPWVFIGKDRNCHVVLNEPSVSSLHATIARVGSRVAIIDHESTNGTWHNGHRISQQLIETGDVVRIGPYWFIFKLEAGEEFQRIDESLRGAISSSGRTIPETDYCSDFLECRQASEGQALVELVSSGGQWATSESRPIVIGSDSACDLRLEGEGVARFHAVVYWAGVRAREGGLREAGVYVEDLHSGHGILHNGQPVERGQLADGDTVRIAGHQITVGLLGDIARRAAALCTARPATGGLAVTCIEGPAAGQSVRLDSTVPRILIGRKEECNLILQCSTISGHHAEIVALDDGSRQPKWVLRDLHSTNGTTVNGRVLEPDDAHRLQPGDIIRLGRDSDHCDLLVHHAL